MHGEEHRLVMVSGPDAGARYTLEPGAHLIGRGPDADLRFALPGLSRSHAYVRRDGDEVTVADAGSTNGTRVGGELITAPQRLAPGAVLDLGDVTFRYEAPHAEPVAATAVHRVANSLGGSNHGTLTMAGRDVNSWVTNRFSEDDPIDELFQGRGLGRVLVAVGLVVALAGFAAWMSLILGGSLESSPFEKEWFGLPAGTLAFGAFAGGGIVASLGVGMSRAARERGRRR